MPLSLPILPVALQKIVDFLRHCSKVETAYSVRESLASQQSVSAAILQKNLEILPPIKRYDDWSEVPFGLNCRSQWRYRRRKVKADAMAVAQVRNADGDEFGRSPFIDLFSYEQTRIYNPTSKTEAIWDFTQFFLGFSAKERFRLEYGPRKWTTKNSRLGRRHFENHLRLRDQLGVFGGIWSRFVVIDLDFHKCANLGVFMEQFEVLVRGFNGQCRCHYAFSEDCSGVHLIFVFPIKKLDWLRDKFRSSLQELDHRFPDSAYRAKTAGMKPLGDLEIYPNRSQAIRLPLGRGRKVLVGRKLLNAGDVEGYMSWLNDAKAESTPHEMALETIRCHTFGKEHVKASIISVPSSNDASSPASEGTSWKGNLLAWTYEFWINGNANGHNLNEHIIVLARWAVAKGHSEWKIRTRLQEFVEELPVQALSGSSRLKKGQFKSIERTVKHSVKYALDNNRCQADPASSMGIFRSIVERFPGIDPLDKSTWSKRTTLSAVTQGNWQSDTIEEMQRVLVTDEATACQFLNEFCCLVQNKERTSAGFGKDYLKVWLNDRFPAIKCGKAAKRQRILVVLQEQGVLQLVEKGRPSLKCASRWTLGPVAAGALGLEVKPVLIQPLESRNQGHCIKGSIIRVPFLRMVEFTCVVDQDEHGQLLIQERPSLITASRRQELRIGAAEGVAEKVEGLHGTLLAAP
jgi:hypothetical protein